LTGNPEDAGIADHKLITECDSRERSDPSNRSAID
jgi:hypothetical protein